jgi:probable HAF family extracellular repeat protein
MRTKSSSPLSLVFFLAISALAAAQVYTVTDLGPLAPTSINSWAQVVGNYNGHAFIWTQWGGMRDLGLLPGGTFSQAAAINDLGRVTGTADGPGTIVWPDSSFTVDCNDLTQTFLWIPNRGMQGLGIISPVNTSWDGSLCIFQVIPHSTAINIRGQVVGYNRPYDTYQFGFVWAAGAFTRFGGSWPPTMALDINKSGKIVGQSSIYANGIGHATVWTNGVSMDLGTLAGGAELVDYGSSATGINERGQVVGWSTTGPVSWLEGSPVHAVVWMRNGVIRDLGTLSGDTSSAASRINLFGQIIGSSGNTEYSGSLGWDGSPFEVSGRPFIWSERTGMQDLNTLIPAHWGWILNSAKDINVWGQIVGEGTLNGQPHGFVLTPRNPFRPF